MCFGEDVEAALRFLFKAMAPKQSTVSRFKGIPQMIYLDSGPVAKRHVFQQAMRYLDIDVRAHLPPGKDAGAQRRKEAVYAGLLLDRSGAFWQPNKQPVNKEISQKLVSEKIWIIALSS